MAQPIDERKGADGLRCRPFLAAAIFLSALSAADAQTLLAGRIVAIADGDTITLLDAGRTQHKIRLDSIDAPESGQPFGQRAKQSLSDLTFGRDAEATCPKTDRYGRRVCKVIVGGVDVGLEQVSRGMAWHFKRYEKEQGAEDRAVYAAAEVRARDAGRGLWHDGKAVPPWDWRAARATSSR